MNTLLTLMQREWLQHRFGWALLILVPLAICLLFLSVGHIELEDEVVDRAGALLPTLLVAGVTTIGALGATVLLTATSLFFMSGLARRDDGDRSNEFWLSMPVGHAPSLGAPLVVHLLLVPMAALLVGLACGLVASVVVVARTSGLGDWFAVPWGDVLPALAAGALRLLAGLPLAMLWLLPVVLLLVLANAWFRRWALPVLVAFFVVGSGLLDRFVGRPVLSEWLAAVVRSAGRSLLHGGVQPPLTLRGPEDALVGLRAAPQLLAADFAGSLAALASPLFVLGLGLSALAFWALLRWRARSGG